ncbi:glycosyltransferase family 2 protein [bacterium]|nr:MAG: glycosyltransferase family 2 protein [bacterium]
MFVRLAVPTVGELTAFCAAAGAVQLAALAATALRRRPAPPGSAPRPSVQILVPCKGVPSGLAANAAALRAQEYAGPAEILFVVPSAADPAHAVLTAASAAPGLLPARVAVSAGDASRCSGKAADLAWALRRPDASSALVVFADADLRVVPGWLSRLTAPLADPSVSAATAMALPVPERPGLWSVLRMLWTAYGLPFLDLGGLLCGQSIAARRADLAAWEVPALWERVVLEDLALANRIRERGGKTVFVHEALSAAREDCSAAEFWGVFNKWTLLFRVYEPRVWVPGLLLTVFKAYCLARGLLLGRAPGLLAALWGLDALYLFLVLAGARSRSPAAFAGASLPGLAASAALGAPLLPLCHLANYAASLGPARARWGSRTYLLRAADDVVVTEAARG